MARMRVQKEFVELEKSPIVGVSITQDFDEFAWTVVMQGIEGTPYEDGLFRFKIWFDWNAYPFKPPDLSFLTDIYHCNLSLAVAPKKTRVDYFLEESAGEWSPSYHSENKARDIIARIQALMREPFCEEPSSGFDYWEGGFPGGCSVDDPCAVLIFVKTLTGETLELRAAPTDLVVNLKHDIAACEGTPAIDELNLVFAGKPLRNKTPISDYCIQAEATLHIVMGPGRPRGIANLIDADLAELLRSDRGIYEQRARDHTRRKALNPKRGPIVTLVMTDAAGVQCTSLSGDMIAVSCPDPKQETIGTFRLLVSAQLGVPVDAVHLISSSGTELALADDHAPLFEALQRTLISANTNIPEQEDCP